MFGLGVQEIVVILIVLAIILFLGRNKIKKFLGIGKKNNFILKKM